MKPKGPKSTALRASILWTRWRRLGSEKQPLLTRVYNEPLASQKSNKGKPKLPREPHR